MPRRQSEPDGDTSLASNGMSPEEFLKHYRAMKDAKRCKEEAGEAFKATRAAFKAVGGDLNAFKIVEHLQSLDDADAELRMRETLRYASWLDLDIGTQADMFGGAQQINLTGAVQAEHQAWVSEQAGYKSGKDGEPIDNCPHPGGSPFHVSWRRGWHDGQAAIAAAMRPKDDPEAHAAP